LTERKTDLELIDHLIFRILDAADNGTYMGAAPEHDPYPQGVKKFLGWGAGTATGRYADVYMFAYRFTTDAARRQSYFNSVSQFSDFALGLNPLGMSFVTGLGTDQPQSPLHLDSYFTKYGLSDGVTSDHVGHPKGNFPGIVIFGPTRQHSGQPYERVATEKLYPDWDDLPQLRRWGDGWSFVGGNEFTVWESHVWNVVMHGFLYDASGEHVGGFDR
jgi:endoglucanase